MIVITHRPIRTSEYEALCRSVGWSDMVNFAVADRALSGSLFQVVAHVDGDLAGMARIVGDGAIFFYVQDVVVDPRFQGRGVGASLMSATVDWLAANAPPKAYAHLFAAEGKEHFYRRYGFVTTPKGMRLDIDTLLPLCDGAP